MPRAMVPQGGCVVMCVAACPEQENGMEPDHISHIRGILRQLRDADPQTNGLSSSREVPASHWQMDPDAGWEFMGDMEEEEA